MTEEELTPETKRTPGPWRVAVFTAAAIQQHDAIGVGDETGRPVAMASPVAMRDEFDLPNARLIAAAPDMLAALDSLCSMQGLDLQSKRIIREIAEPAIAKAKGNTE